jgi:hypothetical protein
MCINCGSDGIGRRDLMTFGAAAAIALAVGGASPAARAAGGVARRGRGARGPPPRLRFRPKTRSLNSRRAMNAS